MGKTGHTQQTITTSSGETRATGGARSRVTMRLAVACSLAAAVATAQAEPVSDEFLQGYLAAVLERSLHWERGSYALRVVQGVATLTLNNGTAERQAQTLRTLRGIEGLQDINIALAPEQSSPTSATGISELLAVTTEMVPLPAGDLFRPLIADPMQPQFFLSYRRYRSADADLDIGAVGFGESFGVYRQQGQRPGDGIQVSVAGGLFAQFDLGAPSSDLVNADYTIGLPLSYRRGPYSARLRLYHQSSHLGDEYLLRVQPARVNLSYEAVEAIASKEWGGWRGYFGGEYLLRREPANLDRASLHGGVELYGPTNFWGIGRLLGGLDLKSFQEHGWALDVSAKAGFEIGHPDPGGRRLRLMGEAFHGYAPHGQFYNERIRYFGLGLYFGF